MGEGEWGGGGGVLSPPLWAKTHFISHSYLPYGSIRYPVSTISKFSDPSLMRLFLLDGPMSEARCRVLGSAYFFSLVFLLLFFCFSLFGFLFFVFFFSAVVGFWTGSPYSFSQNSLLCLAELEGRAGEVGGGGGEGNKGER